MDAGLCETCAHVKRLANSRESVFYLCALAERDAAFRRYPRLPVLNCTGYAKKESSRQDRSSKSSAE